MKNNVSVNGKSFQAWSFEKAYYYAVDVAAAVTKYKLFQQPDGTYGTAGSKTNWQNSGAKLPAGHVMNIVKIGFAYRLSTGAAVTPAGLTKLTTGLYSIALGDNEIRSGSLLEFFDPALTVASATSAPIIARQFIPLLSEAGEWWDEETLNFDVTVPACETSAELVGFLKGMVHRQI
jgi:hypothetical protein